MPEWLKNLLENYGPYIDDLWRIAYQTALFFAIVFAISFFSAGYIINHFIKLFHLSDVTIVVVSPFQFLDLAVDVGMFLAILTTLPFAIYRFYSFLRPAVSGREFRTLLMLLPVSFVLFLFGFAYGFFSLYWGLQMLAQVNVAIGLKNMWDIGLLMSQLSITAMLLGILFQYPLVMSALLRAGIVKRQALIGKRRVAYAIIMVGVSLLPPTDGISLIIMALPLVALFEATIALNCSCGQEYGQKDNILT